MRKFISIEIYELSSLTFQIPKNRQKCLKVCKLPNFQILHATYYEHTWRKSTQRKKFDAAKIQEEGEKYNKKKEWRASRKRGNGRKEREEITATGPQ